MCECQHLMAFRWQTGQEFHIIVAGLQSANDSMTKLMNFSLFSDIKLLTRNLIEHSQTFCVDL